MFPVLDMLNSDKAKKEIWKDIQLGKGDELVEILKQERPYVENKPAKKTIKGTACVSGWLIMAKRGLSAPASEIRKRRQCG